MNPPASGRALDAARKAKHAWLLTRIAAHEQPRKVWSKARDTYYRPRYEGRTYEFQPGQFRRSFVNWDAPTAIGGAGPLSRRVYCFWTGPNELTSARLESLEAMRAGIGVPVLLVTPDNLDEIVVAEHPLHSAYEALSYVHRSDYLRAYVMHHHGGGYSDIKVPQTDWTQFFDAMDADPSIWETGYPENGSLWIAKQTGNLGRELRRRHHMLPGGGAFVMRPHTQLSTEWLAEVERRIGYYADSLTQHPGGVKGDDPLYPISWNRLLAQVHHPLALKHHAHVRVTSLLTPGLSDYR
jgi:hypothetical protein